jgi:hypothetical protein
MNIFKVKGYVRRLTMWFSDKVCAYKCKSVNSALSTDKKVKG